MKQSATMVALFLYLSAASQENISLYNLGAPVYKTIKLNSSKKTKSNPKPFSTIQEKPFFDFSFASNNSKTPDYLSLRNFIMEDYRLYSSQKFVREFSNFIGSTLNSLQRENWNRNNFRVKQ